MHPLDASEKPRIPHCPQCHGRVMRVTQSYPAMYNADQWETIKAGDYYCDVCPPNNRSKGNRYCYWWRREVWPKEEVRRL